MYELSESRTIILERWVLCELHTCWRSILRVVRWTRSSLCYRRSDAISCDRIAHRGMSIWPTTSSRVHVACLVGDSHLSFESSMDCSEAPLMLKVHPECSFNFLFGQMCPVHEPKWQTFQVLCRPPAIPGFSLFSVSSRGL